MIPFAIIWLIWKKRNERISKGTSLTSELISQVTLKIARWALARKKFSNLNMNDLLSNWGACMVCCPLKERRSVFWSPPPNGVLKFNVDGASRGKPGPTGIGGVLRNNKGEVLLMFSKHGVCDSNEAEVLAVLEGIRLFSRRYGGPVVVESDSSNVVAWVSKPKANPWKWLVGFFLGLV